jgi:hypothetical protein
MTTDYDIDDYADVPASAPDDAPETPLAASEDAPSAAPLSSPAQIAPVNPALTVERGEALAAPWRDYQPGSIDPDALGDGQLTALVRAMLLDPYGFDPVPSGNRLDSLKGRSSSDAKPPRIPFEALTGEYRDTASAMIAGLRNPGDAEARQAIVDKAAQMMVTEARWALGPLEGHNRFHAELAAFRLRASAVTKELREAVAQRDEITGYDRNGVPKFKLDPASRAKRALDVQKLEHGAAMLEREVPARLRAILRQDYAEGRAQAEREEFETEARAEAQRLKIAARAREINATRRYG